MCIAFTNKAFEIIGCVAFFLGFMVKDINSTDTKAIKGDVWIFGFFHFMYDIQHCPSDSTVSEDAGIEPRTVATTALAVRRSNHSVRPHPRFG